MIKSSKDKNRTRTRSLRNCSNTRSFIKKDATEEDLQKLKSLIKENREESIEKKDIKKDIHLDKQNKLESINCLENCAVKNIKEISKLIK